MSPFGLPFTAAHIYNGEDLQFGLLFLWHLFAMGHFAWASLLGEGGDY
jgi:hypothetical protein